MRPMTWMPIPLAGGGTLAHAVIPSDMTAGEAEIVCTAIRPLRINGRLAWPVAELRRCVGLRT